MPGILPTLETSCTSDSLGSPHTTTTTTPVSSPSVVPSSHLTSTPSPAQHAAHVTLTSTIGTPTPLALSDSGFGDSTDSKYDGTVLMNRKLFYQGDVCR